MTSTPKSRYRILQTGDIHIGAIRNLLGQEEALRRARFIFAAIAETAKAERCDAVIIAGDLFDSKTLPAEEREVVVQALIQLSSFVDVYVISGNHDTLSESASHVNLLHVIAETQQLPHLHVASSTKESVWEATEGLFIVGASCHLSEDQAWVDNYTSTLRREDGQYIFVGHASIRGCARNDKGWKPRNDDRALSLAVASENEAVVYWCYGDIHMRQPLPTLAAGAHGWYAGSPIQMNFGEESDRGCLIIALDKTPSGWVYRGKRYIRLDDKRFGDMTCAPLVHVTRQEQLEDLPADALLSFASGLVLSDSQRERAVKQFKVVVDSTLPQLEGSGFLPEGQMESFDPLSAPMEIVEEEVLREATNLSDDSRRELKMIVGLGVDRFRNRSFLT